MCKRQNRRKAENHRGQSKDGNKYHVFVGCEISFSNMERKYEILAKKLRELAFLKSGIQVTLNDEQAEKLAIFRFDEKIKQFISFFNRRKRFYMENRSSFTARRWQIQTTHN
jgi:DNA gyrase subunit B